MTEAKSSQSLCELVLAHSPRAKLTYEICTLLHKHLPLNSIDDVRRAVPSLALGGLELTSETLVRFVPAELFPVRSADDLVRKVSGLVQIAVTQVRPGERLPAATKKQIDQLTGSAEPIPTAYFSGPSIFGYQQAKGY